MTICKDCGWEIENGSCDTAGCGGQGKVDIRIAETLRTDKIITCEKCGWELENGTGKCTNEECFKRTCIEANEPVDVCRDLPFKASDEDEHTVNINIQMPDHSFKERVMFDFDAGTWHLSTDKTARGMKKDDGKQKWHALPLVLLEPLADVMEAGVKKYAKFNCLQPFEEPDERFYNGVMRHLEGCQLDPLAIDEETGCYHAAQIAFNTLMRLYHCKKIIEDKGYEHG